jgi:hypothetical protein
MVDYQRQLLDELMGRHRNLDPGTKIQEKSWKHSENCKFFMVSFHFNIDFANNFMIKQEVLLTIAGEVAVMI